MSGVTARTHDVRPVHTVGRAVEVMSSLEAEALQALGELDGKLDDHKIQIVGDEGSRFDVQTWSELPGVVRSRDERVKELTVVLHLRRDTDESYFEPHATVLIVFFAMARRVWVSVKSPHRTVADGLITRLKAASEREAGASESSAPVVGQGIPKRSVAAAGPVSPQPASTSGASGGGVHVSFKPKRWHEHSAVRWAGAALTAIGVGVITGLILDLF